MSASAAARPAVATAAGGRRVASAAVALGALVGAAFAARLALVLLQATPTLLPDEYIYTALSRSIAEGGLPSIRGEAADFPALLAPLLTAPAWLHSDVETGYRLAQAIGALALSLTAVPVYLLARRVGVAHRVALAVAAFALVVPDTVYAAFLTAESFAYPLALATVLAGVRALERPSYRWQGLFVALAALTTVARVQFVVLAPAFVVACVVVGWRERRLRAALREQWLALGVFAVLAGGFAVLGLGYYGGVVELSLVGGPVLASAGTNLVVLCFAAGIAIVPGAVLGIGLGIVRPASRAELAFAALTLALAAALLEEAAIYGEHVHERYVFYVVPLLAIGFARYAQRGWPHRAAHALLALALVTAATRVALTTLGERGEANAAVLLAVRWLTRHVGSAGDASLVALVAATVAAALAAAAGWRPRLGVPVVLGASAVLAVSALGAVVDYNRGNSSGVREGFLPARADWVDAAGLGEVALLQAPGGLASRSLLHLVWNRSVQRVLLLPGAEETDTFARSAVRVDAHGTLLAGGRPVVGPLLVDRYGSLVRFRGAATVAAAPDARLVVPGGPARLELLARGWFGDGWIGSGTRLTLWAPPGRRLEGTVRFSLSLPADAAASTASISLPGGEVERVRLRPGAARQVSLPACGGTRWTAGFRFDGLLVVEGRLASARATEPVLVPGGCGA